MTASEPMRWRLTLTCAAASSVAFLDGGGFVLAAPAAANELGAAFASTQLWVAAPLAMVGGLVLTGGWLGDRFGPLRVLRAGLVAAVVTTVLAASAPSSTLLTVARLGQGLSFALFVPTSLALLRAQPGSARAVRLWTTIVSITTLSAPGVAAVLIALSSWRTALHFEAAAAVLALVATRRLPAPGSGPEPIAPPAPLAFALLATGSMAIVLGATLPRAGPLWPAIVLGGGLVAVSLGTLRRRAPATFPPAAQVLNGFTLLAYGAMTLVPFLLSLYLQGHGRFGPIGVGLLLSVEGLVLAALTPVLTRRQTSPWRPLAAGALLSATGAGALALVAATWGLTSVPVLVLGLAVLGVGSALFVAPLTHGVLVSVDAGAAGRAAGLNLSLARLSAATAVAVIGPLLTIAASAAMTADGCCPAAVADQARAAPLGATGVANERTNEPLPSSVAAAGADAAVAAGLTATAVAHLGAAAVVIGRRRSLEPAHEDE